MGLLALILLNSAGPTFCEASNRRVEGVSKDKDTFGNGTEGERAGETRMVRREHLYYFDLGLRD